MKSSVQSAKAEAVGFSTSKTLSQDICKNFVQNGFAFTVRYLWNGDSGVPNGLSEAEVGNILGSGLALMAAYRPNTAATTFTQEDGESDAQAATSEAMSAGLPLGAQVWADFSEINLSRVPGRDLASYCQAWCQGVATSQFVPGLLLSSSMNLSDEELDSLPCDFFWRSGQGQPPYPANGFCLLMNSSERYVLDGIPYDRNVTQHDCISHLPLWVEADLSSKPKLNPKPAVRYVALAIAAYAVGAISAFAFLHREPATPLPNTTISSANKPASVPSPSPAETPPKTTVSPTTKPTPSTPPATTTAKTPISAPPKSVAATPPKKEPATQVMIVAATFRQKNKALQLVRKLEPARLGKTRFHKTGSHLRPNYEVTIGPINGKEATATAGTLRTRYGLKPRVQPTDSSVSPP